MPNPAGTYYCDIKTDTPEDLHYGAKGMQLCDTYNRGSISDLGDSEFHEVVRRAEDAAWEQGYAQGVTQGKGGELLTKMVELLEKVDDDEVGLFLAELKAGAQKG